MLEIGYGYRKFSNRGGVVSTQLQNSIPEKTQGLCELIFFSTQAMNAVEQTRSEDDCSRGKTSDENGGDDSSEEAENTQNKAKPNEKAKKVESARVVYSLEELLELRGIAASKVWPSVLGEEYVRDGFWDPELWHQSQESAKRCASPVEDIRRQVIKADGIVLSPQRQSFGQGCHAPHSAPERGTQQDRIKTMIGRSMDRERDGRSRLTGRVGRGRSSEYSERTPLRDRNRDPNEVRRPGHRDRPSRDRFERGDYQDRPKRSREEDSSNRQNRGRSKTYEDEDEPEWFAHGPTSQFDTIELKGFDRDEKNNKPGKGKKRENGEVDSSDRTTSKSPSMLKNDPSTKTEVDTHDAASEDENEADSDSKGFDINQFFMSETILPFSGGVEQVSSRFSQFFGSGSRSGSRSNSRTGSRRSSIADDFVEFSGYSSPRPASPAQEFMFAPITPSPPNLDTNPEILAEILQKTKINVKPLLDTVLSGGKEAAKIKGELHLEDIEADLEAKRVVDQKNKENLEHMKEPTDLTAFNMLVETMKTTGTLPDKESQKIPDVPSHLLHQASSPKSKISKRTPSPSLKSYHRCPSPVELMQQVALQASLVQRPPSPAQVVPQMERALSPYGMLHKPIATPAQNLFGSPALRRSPSPLSTMFTQRRTVPLLGPDAFTTPAQFNQQPMASPPPIVMRPTPQAAKPLGRMSGLQPKRHDARTGRQHEPVTPKTAPSQTAKSSPSLTSMSFMPTSVMKNLHNQKTPKGSSSEETKESKDPTTTPHHDSRAVSPRDAQKENSEHQNDMLQIETKQMQGNQATASTNSPSEKTRENERKNQMSPMSQLRQQIAQHDPILNMDERLNTKPTELKTAVGSPPRHSQQEVLEKKVAPLLLQQPSAFKPSTLSPRSNYSIRPDGSHSEPQTPYHSIGLTQMKEPLRSQSHSAPCTPQRHPLARKAALLPQSQGMEHDPGKTSVVNESWLKETRNDHQVVVPHSEIKTHMPTGHGIASHLQNGPPQQESKLTVSSHPPQRRNSFEGRSDRPPRQPDTFRRPLPVGEMKQNLTPQEMNQYRMRQESLMHQQNSAFSGGRASPPVARPMQGIPPRGAFLPPYRPLPMSHQGAMNTGLVSAGIPPPYLARYGMVSPGMASQGPITPPPHTMPVPHPSARYPVGHPAGQSQFLYGPRPSPNYPAISPTAMMVQQAQAQAQQIHSMRMAPQFMQGGRASPSTLPHREQSPQPIHETADSNPLTKWFSADMLKQATPRAASVPDVNRKMLSVEELERQQTTVPN